MKITGNLLLTSCLFSLFIILVNFLGTSHANNPHPDHHNCSPSACGIIHNISLPFRLKDDPKHCGYAGYEIACENNVALIYLGSQKYHVKAINYQNLTIRLVDVSINVNDGCSFPKYDVSVTDLIVRSPYDTVSQERSFSQDSVDVAWPINFMSCPYQLKKNNSSLFFTETTDSCAANGDSFFHSSNNNSGGGRHTYIKVGHMNASDVKYMCRVDLIVLTSWEFKDFNNVTLSEIHESLLYGFELSWYWPIHLPIYVGTTWDKIRTLFVGDKGPNVAVILILLLTIVLSLVAKIILGFTCVLGILIIVYWEWFLDPNKGIALLNFLVILGFSFAARFTIGFLCMMGLLIYKFRRRHLSMFDAIEGFLRSENNLTPIRYSYSDIKKMTRGFREKLGQGGYGSVYKGKLRSGHDVAVKLLGKPRVDGQDFINEIATIGRIHHVNVVKLVGYCAERSKRALVFDFMPNGSLEKYIFGREKMNSLNWKTKFEIAVGVARGIEYLHRGCDIQILHFDIKPHNILLNEKFIPKISDFGLAKSCSTQKNTVTLTAARGTIGYVAPELINGGIGRVSYKADVYSFGMLLMEMVGLKRDLTGNNETSSQYFPYWIYDCFNQGNDIEIGKADDDDDDNADTRRKIARKMTIVALWCIQMSPEDRPSMNKVLEMLEGEVERLQIPNRPSQSPQVAAYDEDESWTSTCSTDHSASLLCHDAAPTVEITVEDLQSLLLCTVEQK